MSPAKLTRLPRQFVLWTLVLVAGCAHQPKPDQPAPATAVPPSPPAAEAAPSIAAVAVTAQSAAADATALSSESSTATDALAAPMDTAMANLDAEALPGPPADSVVILKQADLWERLRGGFQLDDVDEAAVAAQLNWFANHPDFLERTFGRAELWLYYIVGQLEQRDMPRELALLPVIESAFEPYAYSRARASGLWQFISDTGRRFGLKQDWWYDGRRDPIEATRAALDYLQALHDEFNGDWLLAIAAYNCGELAVSRAIERNQRAGKPTDFWHLKLPAETRAYVPELLAMRRLVANPARYGLEFSRIVNEPYFVPISTGGQIDLQVVANIAGISTEDLYTLNPAFHRWATDPTGPHRLLVPADSAEGLEQTLAQLTPEQRMRIEHYSVQRGDTVASIARRFATKPEVIRELNELGLSDPLVIETALRVPSSNIVLPEKAARAAMLFDSPVRLRRHRGVRPDIRVVRRGDTLYGIAQRLGTDVQTLAAANGLRPGDRLHAGQKLRVASSTPVAYSSSAAGKSAYRASASAQTVASSDSARRVLYRVRRGDTLYSIARLLQVTVIDLVGWNRMSGDHSIKPGQTLIAFVRSRT
ncbi:MAG TPA: LysM peptidoglycan-binding domain-containing protein [Steroidobacteraceae bacterium]|nr:LysM peptidoglycan-binding domain-containing protein [Steroidobacteraceae bacterium]